MNIDQLLSSMSPAVFERLQQVVETGKWFDGTELNEHQREMCLQAVLLYQSKIQQSEQFMTVNAQGDIVHKSKRELREELNNTSKPQQDPSTIATFKQHDF